MRGDETEDTEEGPLEGQGNLEGLRELVEWCKGVMGYEGDTAGWAREVVKRNAEMVAGWQVSRDVSTALIQGQRLDARSAEHGQHQYSWHHD